MSTWLVTLYLSLVYLFHPYASTLGVGYLSYSPSGDVPDYNCEDIGIYYFLSSAYFIFSGIVIVFPLCYILSGYAASIIKRYQRMK